MRNIFKLIVITILVFYLSYFYIFPEIAEVVKMNDYTNIYVVTDIHYMAEEIHDNSTLFESYVNNGDKLIQYSEVFMDALYSDIVKNKPDAVVFAGDLTNSGAKVCHEDFAKRLSDIESTGTKAYVVPGNHDIGNERAVYFSNNEIFWADYISKDEFTEIYGDYGYNDSISRDTDSLSYLTKINDELYALIIDTTIDFPKSGGYINNNTLQWITECSSIAKEQEAKLIAVMHHSLIDHSDLINENYTIFNNTSVLEVFHNCNIEVVLSGHIHLQDIKSHYSKETYSTIYDIATSGLSIYPHQYGNLKYSPGEGYNYETVKLDIEKYASDNKLQDINLINFNEYSAQFFVDSCCKFHRENIIYLLDLSDVEKGKIINTVTEMNKMYFSGFRNELLHQFKETPGFELLMKSNSGFVKSYVTYMLEDEFSDNNKLTVPFTN